MLERRLVSLALASASTLALACGGGEDPTSPGSDPGPETSSLSVSPSSSQADALGDTIHFSATVRDQNGDALSDVAVDWSSTDGSVVTVGDEGEAVAEANGSAGVIASAEGLADTANVTVDQAADAIDVSPSVDTVAAGDSLQLSAEAADANGNAISGADFAWSSSDESVATVDSTGLVRAESDGAVQITAELDGVTEASDLTVEPGPGPEDGPVVSSVSPTPLPEGGTATISGSNFDTSAGGNTVTVDGVEATVNSAGSTSLEITVPQYDCLPARDVSVEVSTGAGSDAATAGLSPDEAPVDLAVGQQLRVENPSEFCLQFDASFGSSAYLFGVQSVSEAATAITPASVFSVTAGSAASTDGATLSLSERPRLDGSGRTLEDRPLLQAHAEAELARMRSARQRLEGRATNSLPYRQRTGTEPLAAAVPGTVSEGDSVDLTIASLDAVCQVAATITGEVRHMGTHGIWITDVDNPSGGYTDADIEQLADQFDALSYPTDTLNFGSPPDTDANDRVVLVISQEVNRQGGVLGFVSPGDFFPEADCPASNEGEFTYLIAPDPNGTVGPVRTASTLLEEQPTTIAHELVHMIQTGRRFTAGHDFLDIWLAEGQAVFGEEVVGHEATGRSTGANHGISVASEGNSSSATEWYWNAFTDLAVYFGFETNSSKVSGAPEECGWMAREWAGGPCIGNRSVYGTPWSLLRWATDHYGPSHPGGKEGFQRDLIGSSENGFALLEQLTGAPIEEMLGQWAASLYVDDRVASADPLLTQPSWNYFDIYQSLVESARLVPLEASFTDFEATGNIRSGSSGYLRISDTSRPATALRVRTTNDNELPASMQVWLVRLE